MRNRNWVSMMAGLGACLVLGLGVWAGDVVAQTSLQIGGSASNFGSHTLRGGFMPDPWTTSITSGGNIDASNLGLGSGCTGYVTRQPDYILNYNSPAGFLRIYFEGNGDTTLVINDGNGRWHCNDDSHGGLNPTVDLNRPASGHYDIWVGSYGSGVNVSGTLHVTELQSQHP